MTQQSVTQQIVYVDMDGVLVDFKSGLLRVDPAVREQYLGHEDDIPGVFALMKPMPGAIEAFTELSAVYDTYILSTASWRNPSAWSDKLSWVHERFGYGEGSPAYKRLILSHHKHLNSGAWLIDDRTRNGADKFGGELIQFGTPQYPDWDAVLDRLLDGSEARYP